MKAYIKMAVVLIITCCCQLGAEDYDVTQLAKRGDLEQLKKDFYGLRLNFTAVPDEEKRPDLFREAQYWMSQNEKLRHHCERFFKETPHTVQTVNERVQMLELLGYLVAEWSVKLLLEEAMVDREGQDTAGLTPPLDEWEEWRINAEANQGFPDFVRNDVRAARKLYKMKLKEIPRTRWGEYNPKKMEELREWYRKNKNRLDEVVTETWGDKAVLNKDMPGYEKKLKAGKKGRYPDRLDAASAKELREAQEEGGTADVYFQEWLMWGTGGVLLLGVSFYLWRKTQVNRNE